MEAAGRGTARNGAAPERGVRLRRARPVSAPRGTVPSLRPPRRGAAARSTPPGPAMLRPEPLCLLLLLLPLLPHAGRAASPTPSAAPSPLNGTEAAAAGNGTRPGPPPASRAPPGSVLPAGSGLPVLKRAVYVLSALSALAAFYFLLRAFR